MTLNPGEVGVTTSTVAGPNDRRWLGDLTALAATEPGTLDGDLFPAGTFPDGRVPSGQVLGRVTATGRLAPYTPAAANGTETAVGHLLDDASVGAGRRVPVAVVTTGAVIRNRLPAGSGLDAAAEADLVHIRYRNI